jgi:hypothetical protein
MGLLLEYVSESMVSWPNGHLFARREWMVLVVVTVGVRHHLGECAVSVRVCVCVCGGGGGGNHSPP